MEMSSHFVHAILKLMNGVEVQTVEASCMCIVCGVETGRLPQAIVGQERSVHSQPDAVAARERCNDILWYNDILGYYCPVPCNKA
jgi:hypothetical protein